MDSNIEIIMLIYHTRTVKVVLFICTRVVYGILSKVLSRYFRTKVLYYINLQRYSMKVRKYGTKVYFRTKVRKYFRTYLATTFVLYLFRTFEDNATYESTFVQDSVLYVATYLRTKELSYDTFVRT